jgi:hypothetical protein
MDVKNEKIHSHTKNRTKNLEKERKKYLWIIRHANLNKKPFK